MYDMSVFLTAALLLSVMVNIGAIFLLLKMNKKESLDPTLTTDEIYIGMEEFVRAVEKENNYLFQNMTDYIKVKERELEKRIRAIEDKQPVSEIVQQEVEIELPKIEDIPLKEHEESGSDKVETLYKQGFSSAQIAKVLKIELGQVELIINMLKIKKSYQ